jgi:hypothetical protein
VSIGSNAPAAPHLVALNGSGVRTVTVTPDPLNFGDVQVGTPTSLFVTVRNAGVSPVQLMTLGTSGDFSVTPPFSCPVPGPLPAAASCTIRVTVTATVAGPRTGTLTLTSSAPASPHTIVLQANGVPAQLTVTPDPLNFGDVQVGTPTSLFVTVRNAGVGPVQLLTLGTSGDFSMTPPFSCLVPGPLPAAASCTIQMTVTATVAGPRTGTLTLTSSAPASPHTVTLLANGALTTTTIEPSSLMVASRQQAVTTTTTSTPTEAARTTPVASRIYYPEVEARGTDGRSRRTARAQAGSGHTAA